MVQKVLFLSYYGSILTNLVFFCGSFAPLIKTWVEIFSSIADNHGCYKLFCRRFEFFYWCTLITFHRYLNIYILKGRHKWHFQFHSHFEVNIMHPISLLLQSPQNVLFFFKISFLDFISVFVKFIFSWMFYDQLSIKLCFLLWKVTPVNIFKDKYKISIDQLE